MGDRVYLGKKGTKTAYPTRRRSGGMKRRPLNQYECESDEQGVSASAKKLKDCNEEFDVNSQFSYRIINFCAVFSVIAQHVKCKTCGSKIEFRERSPRGLGFKIVIACPKCPDVDIPSSKFIRNAYEINRRIVLAMRLIGIGLQGIKKFCAFMDLPQPIFHSFYDKLVKTIAIATKAVRDASMKKAAQEEKEGSHKIGKTDGITVSGDGSWRKRGFSSLFGVTSLIGWLSGKIIDVEVKSKYCKSCEHWKSKNGTTEFEEWQISHADECQANHEGSSGKMEVNAVVEMFQRSEDLYGVKYSNYIGDGDSKTFKGIVDSKPYENFDVHKKECIDHVQKRMGTRLRNLKKGTKGLGGRENWCSWKKAKAENALDAYHHNQPMSEEVYQAIKPIYVELSRDDLLERCLGACTQNNNESFNATVWSLAPKSSSSGKTVLDIATDIAVCTFNGGLTNVLQIFKMLEVEIGAQLYNFCTEADAKRITHAEASLSDAAKSARALQKSTRKDEEDKNLAIEGQMYGAGIAD
ncbi:unnamed protein product [Arctia plantaginis]|uniref:Mutator-like transposase domain-containing protein n=1 Tax=Arctia plantaginis TaxID=874455 RepID=A0A8S0Z0X3_ARCPL|nr:unnamed protein product [Arctia plantaginis]